MSDAAPRPPLPHGARAFWLGARPRTLGASIVPVLVGTAAADWQQGQVDILRAALALAVGLGLQVGVNYANDYFDGVKGVDTSARLGPPRLVASGMTSARAVRTAAAFSFLVAAGAGIALCALTSWWLLLLGAIALAAAVLYSGGPRPYAGLGLGELSVFLFFGLAATVGSAYIQTFGPVRASLPPAFLPPDVPAAPGTVQVLIPAGNPMPGFVWWFGAAIGLLAVAILVANNLRDISSDAAAGKRTLAVRLGEEGTRALYIAVVAGAYMLVIVSALTGRAPLPCISVVYSAPIAVVAIRRILRFRGRDLIPALLATAALHAMFGVLLAVPLLLVWDQH